MLVINKKTYIVYNRSMMNFHMMSSKYETISEIKEEMDYLEKLVKKKQSIAKKKEISILLYHFL